VSNDLALAAIAATAFAVWAFRAYFMPMADCKRCEGTGKNAVTRQFGKGKRHGKCGKCKGSGDRWVLGAKTVHKALRRSSKKG
jgi:excinuclease UvrABC ATPase subunit